MKLDKKWQCCGYEIICFKSFEVEGEIPRRRCFLCTTCNREYDTRGRQRENWAWKRNAVGSYRRRAFRAQFSA